MLLWHSSFSYSCLTHRRVKCNLVWQWERKLHFLWVTWIRFVLLQGCFLSFAFWKFRTIWEEKPDLISHFTYFPACAEGARTEKNKAIRRSTVAFVVRPLIHRRCGVSYLSIEARAFTLLVLTVNWNHFWCETCLLCVDVFFV